MSAYGIVPIVVVVAVIALIVVLSRRRLRARQDREGEARET
jgi:hypothetical protein